MQNFLYSQLPLSQHPLGGAGLREITGDKYANFATTDKLSKKSENDQQKFFRVLYFFWKIRILF
jgi:hypothetical protein